MAEARAERRLAAILATDIVGYSRLMGGDEEGTLAALKSLRESLIDQKIAEHRGHIVKTTGDGALVEFASAVDAVRCAIDIQRAMIERNAEIPEDRRIELRIGINVGDIIIEGEDIYGDGVNIAARLEGIAEAGGICISRQVFDQIEGKLQLAYRQMGLQNLKNITKPIEVFSVAVDEAEGPSGQTKPSQEIKYCRTPDGVRLAYAISGNGPPLVKSANWMNHLEYDWESPVWRHVFRGLSSDYTLIRYDARGNGMSDWDVDELSLDAWVSDLETVVDAARVERFPGATQEQAASFNELQRRTTSPEIAARYFDVVGDFDITDLLAKVTTKTLVMHVRGDLVCPIEAGRVLAAGIPGARFVALQGQNHLFQENEQASQRFFEELKLFLGN
jgi:class 3 adenylate cyclase